MYQELPVGTLFLKYFYMYLCPRKDIKEEGKKKPNHKDLSKV